MSDYCVIIRGRLPGNRDDASLWAPIASSLRLDQATFASRVLAALPLIVRRQLDRHAASALVASLEQAGVDACAVPDDAQLIYLERDGSTRGPVPLSALEQFIRPGERYRLRNTQEWKTRASADALDTTPGEAADRAPSIVEAAAPKPARPDDNDTGAMPASGNNEAEAPQSAVEESVDAAERANAVASSADPSPPPLPPTLPPGTPSSLPPEDPDGNDKPAEDAATTDGEPSEPGALMRFLLPVGRTGLSIAAGYLGLLAVIPFIAPLTLIVSILAWRDLKRRPDKHGHGRVLFGMIMGVGMTALLVFGVAIGLHRSDHDNPLPPATATSTASAPELVTESSTQEPVTPPSAMAASAASVATSSTAASSVVPVAPSSTIAAPAASRSAAPADGGDTPAKAGSASPAMAATSPPPASTSSTHR